MFSFCPKLTPMHVFAQPGCLIHIKLLFLVPMYSLNGKGKVLKFGEICR